MINKIVDKIKKCLPKNIKSFQIHEPQFNKLTTHILNKCIQSSDVSSQGEYIEKFTKKIKNITKAKYVLLTNSGTSALFMALKKINVSQCEVLLPSMTFVATSNAIIHAGGIPHFIDSNKDNLNVDYLNLKNYLSDICYIRNNKCINKKTKNTIKAIVVVHAYGYPANIIKLRSLAKKYKIIIIEDAAGALGSKFDDRHVGTFSRIGILSFNGNKTVTTGMGGAMLFKYKNDYDSVKHLTSTAKINHDWKIDHDKVGYNFRMANINAALGCSQLQDFTKILRLKKKLYQSYLEIFSDDKYCTIPEIDYNSTPNYWVVNLFFRSKYKQYQQELIKVLHKQKIYVREIWKPQHLLPMYVSNPRSKIIHATKQWKLGVSLPSSYYK